ncbi:MAG: DUF167 domain-containing protein [Deltaproteobacteria bacterium]|jgi:uncharacterized protein (TIGR00251 family)|nr:DUF167 domain-containing protein [Deltaproteobacteria bacterium]
MLPLKETRHGITFPVQVVPRASKCEITGLVNGLIKIRLTAPPVGGKANEECLRFLSKRLDIPGNRLSIVSGRTSRRKVIQVSRMGLDELAGLLKKIIPKTPMPDLFENGGKDEEP